VSNANQIFIEILKGNILKKMAKLGFNMGNFKEIWIIVWASRQNKY